MALLGGMKDNSVKHQFATREGTYKLMALSETFYMKRPPYSPQTPASSIAEVKTSFVKYNDIDEDEYICFTVGRELFYFSYKAFKQAKPLEFLDKRNYKGVSPSCHDINQHTASSESVKVAVGFNAGQVQIIDVQTKDSLQIINEERTVEKSKVTCVKWYPKSENLILSAHISGFMYTYDINSPSSNCTPLYNVQPFATGDGYSIFTVKTKPPSVSSSSSNSTILSSPNPVYKWVMSTDGSGVHAFQFSPCSRFVAIVTQNGYLRIINHANFEIYGCMKSYFGGLLSCSWSPDGRFIVTGGEDDLITVWSFCQQCVIARGNGHRSWVSEVAFDPFYCKIPSDDHMKAIYGLPSVDDIIDDHASSRSQSDSSSFNVTETLTDSVDSSPRVKLKTKPSKDSSKKDDSLQFNCNGSGQLSVPTNAMRRLRTYSNISRISHLSIGLDDGNPPLIYRFGSVGQDAQLCVWEVDGSVILFSEKTKINSKAAQHRPNSHTSADAIIEHPSSSINGNISGSESPVNGGSGSENSGSGYQYYMYNHKTGNAIDTMSPLVPSSRSNSVPNSINNAVKSTKENKPSSKSDNSSNGLSAIRKFATIGSHDQTRKQKKEHKRNLSLPHFGLKNTLNHSNSSSSKAGLNKKHPDKVVRTFGTSICPTLEETTMLEPLVCKKVCVGRMTCLIFKEDCVVTTCQDGYMQLWKRPNSGLEINSPSSSPPLKERMTPNGTTV